MTAKEALAYIRKHGVVLVSAQGPVPKLVEAIAGGPIAGSWWGHPKGREIFNTLEEVTGSPDILVCRLVGEKLTLAHKRVWPAIVRASDRFSPRQLARVRQEHTPSGKHVNHETPYPEWVPAVVSRRARALTESDALGMLGRWAGDCSPS